MTKTMQRPQLRNRVVALVSICAASVMGTGLQAQTMPEWIEAAQLCFDVIENQSDAPLATYSEVAGQLKVEGVQETAVQIDQILLNAAFSEPGWFLCIAKSLQEPARDVFEAEWLRAIETAFPEPSFYRVAFHHKAQIDPAMVFCREEGLIALFAFEGSETGDFRVGATQKLPNNIESPCLEGVS